MSAYYGEWRLISEQPVPPELVAQARKLVGVMLEIQVDSKTVRNADGSTISVLIVDGSPRVVIEQVRHEHKSESAFVSTWIPRGFVVYPAWSSAPFGVGLPIVQSGSNPYATINLSPGLDVARWTAGGTCGEVLVSPDENAAYPPDLAIPAPLLADKNSGPTFHTNVAGNYDARSHSNLWKSYRLELAPFIQHYADENAAIQTSLFEAVNTARTAAGQLPTTLRFRGYARVAEITASIMLTAGTNASTSLSYPAAYSSQPDRMTKEGYSADWTQAVLPSFTRADLFAAEEFSAVGALPADAVAAWGAQPNSLLTANLGSCVTVDVGYRNGYSVLALAARDRWIEAGNANWQSADTTVPPLSWHSFASVNLAWETYPARYDTTNYQTTPLVPLFDFTDSYGDCWLRYPRGTVEASAHYDVALGRHIYCRGRSIALAPNGGLIWGACALPVNGAVDRLIALVHHPADQPSDTQAEGFTRYLRVWWCDVPRRDTGLRLAPQEVICGVFDAELNYDLLAWRGGTLVDLGSMPAPSADGWAASSTDKNSLKYASCWRFATDGSKAVCLRDYGALADYQFLHGEAWSAGLQPRAVELALAVVDDTTLNVATTFHDFTAGVTQPERLLDRPTPLDSTEVFGSALFETGAVPIAVDYGADGALVYAYSAQIVSQQQQVYSPTDGSASFSRPIQYLYVGTGDAGVQYASDLQYRLLQGAGFRTRMINRTGELALVLDVASATFALKLVQPRFYYNVGSADPDQPAPPLIGLSPDYTCQTFTSNAVNGVQLARQGAVLAEDWYAALDGAVWSVYDPCYLTSGDVTALVYLPQAVSGNVQGYYAERFNEHVFGYQCAPMPSAVPMLADAPSGSPCGCVVTIEELEGSTLASFAQQAPRGGRAVSSVPLPANDWLIFGKVV